MSKLKDTQTLIWIKRGKKNVFDIILQHLRNKHLFTSIFRSVQMLPHFCFSSQNYDTNYSLNSRTNKLYKSLK